MGFYRVSIGVLKDFLKGTIGIVSTTYEHSLNSLKGFI